MKKLIQGSRRHEKRNDETHTLVDETQMRLSQMLAQIVCINLRDLTESGLFPTCNFLKKFN